MYSLHVLEYGKNDVGTVKELLIQGEPGILPFPQKKGKLKSGKR